MFTLIVLTIAMEVKFSFHFTQASNKQPKPEKIGRQTKFMYLVNFAYKTIYCGQNKSPNCGRERKEHLQRHFVANCATHSESNDDETLNKKIICFVCPMYSHKKRRIKYQILFRPQKPALEKYVAVK